jgi:hypothetical protein
MTQTDRYSGTMILLAFAIGLLPSVMIWFWMDGQVRNLGDNFRLLSAVNVGNVEADVVAHLGKPYDMRDSVSEDLAVDDYLPVPSKLTQHVAIYKQGSYLLYVFYEDRICKATFISRH